jgi:hypothetical protein
MSRLLQEIILRRIELYQKPQSRYDVFKRLIYDFDPNIHKILGSWTEFDKYCDIMDGNVIYMFPNDYKYAYLHIMYQYTSDCQVSMIKVSHILDKTAHKSRLSAVHNELYRKFHKETMGAVHEDLLNNYWSYDNIALWRHEVSTCTRTIMA